MRLIDGDALKRKMQKVATEAWKMKLTASVETVMNQFIDYINEAPTIEPKQGEWIGDKCSICGNERAWYGCNPPYCPDCGAKMKGEDDAD